MSILKGSLLAVCLIAAAMAMPQSDPALRAVSDGISQFSQNFFQTVAEQETGNLITSPLSAALVLSMAAYGARGNTAVQFKNVLHIPADDAVSRSGYQSIVDSLNGVKDVELRVGNKIFTNDKFSVKPTYKDLTETFFRSGSESVDFGNSAAAANIINSWVNEQTNSRIKDIVDAGDLSASTAMVLVNAVYFKGEWKKQFNPEQTKSLPFNVKNNLVKNVPTMFMKSTFNYGVLPEMKAKFIEIPYKGNELSMLIILPDEVEGLAEVERKLQNTNIADIVNSGYSREVNLHLPKFKIESKIDLKAVLEKLGLTDAFTARADFTGIADADLAVSKVVQKAFIEVNEEGSEAAGVTGMKIEARCRIIPLEVTVDRPFLFSITPVVRNRETGVRDVRPIFSGRVAEPQLS